MKNLIYSVLFFFSCSMAFAQVTTSSIAGTVKSDDGKIIAGATVQLVHKPSGSKYGTVSNDSGYFIIPAVRPGGPYVLKVSYVGYKNEEYTDIEAPLGKTVYIDVFMQEESTALKEVVVKATPRNNVISKNRTGASQQFSKREINAVPITGSRSINDVTKYNPNGNGRSFGSQDSRLNNFTIDGSVFNNGFGLGSSAQAGGRTGSTAISLDAIEQLQVNIAPFDVRQSGFVGAGINAVTRSGTNEIEGSVYHSFRNESNTFLGKEAAGREIVRSKFDEKIYGLRFGAPIIKDKLFIFGNYESIKNTSPATNWTSTGSPLAGTQVSTPTFQQMSDLSNFMRTNFGYETGPWEGFDALSQSDKFLIKLDWNINNNHKLSARYVHHDSSSDQLISNSQSLGIGNRTNRLESMSYQNSGYLIFDNTRSAVLEYNGKLTSKLHVNAIFGYDKQNEDRGQFAQTFPTIDIRNNGANAPTLISLGTDPFTPGNKLNYSNLHGTVNVTRFFNKHSVLAGVNYERFVSNNSFFPGSHGVYVFNSLTDFYTAANQTIAANGAPSAFIPSRFQFRYSALPGGAEPLQILKSNKWDVYLQDEWRVNNRFTMTAGLRVSLVSFDDTALENPTVAGYSFAGGRKYDTGKMPDSQVLYEPRLGMNLDVFGNSKTQLRGGFGMFTGRPPYVFISNQIGNNGVLTGFIDDAGGAAPNYGFTPNPAQYYIPANAATAVPSSFDLAFTEEDYKFPQVFKVNVAWDQKLPFGFISTIEGIFNKNVNETFYYNANAEGPVGTFSGPDGRPRFARNNNGNRINDNVSMAAVLGNSSRGYYQSLTAKIEYPAKKGLFGSFAYTISESKDLLSAGSIASGSWQSALSVTGNNNLDLALSDNDIPHRLIGVLGFRKEYGKKLGGATSVSLGYIGEQSGRFSHSINGDMNGDGVNNNDLMYVPFNGSEIRFETYTQAGNTYTEAMQQQALENYIANDPYLSSIRGRYAERNAIALPFLHRVDLSITQDIKFNTSKTKNALQIRADILNFGNLLNSDWGVSKRATAPRLLSYRSTNGSGEPVYRFATQVNNDGTQNLAWDRFQKNSSPFDVWQAQLTLRYTFGG